MANRPLKMKKKKLESYLQELDSLESSQLPRDAWYMEQYPTPPSVAAEVLTQILLQARETIEGKIVMDLGCGSGPLAIGCVLLGAERVIALDIDINCVHLTERNAMAIGITKDQLMCRQCDVRTLSSEDIQATVDTVVMNPPFGTKYDKGIDKLFIEKALLFANVIYSFHKSSTRHYWITTVSKELNCTVTPMFKVKFPIDKLFKFHRVDSKDVDVDILKFVKN